MKSANASPSGAPPAPNARPPRAGQSHARFASAQTPSQPPAGGAATHARWGRCEEDAMPEAPEPPLSRAGAEEPRTGVVRVLSRRESAQASTPAPRATTERPVARSAAEQPASGVRAERQRNERTPASSSEWRCLEQWGQPNKDKERRMRSSKVTIVQMSKNGDLIRQNGPDAWLPEAGDFIQRMSRLLAHGLGFERCRSLCLKGASSVLTVTEAGDTKVVAVSGPARSMSNVLRRAGLE